MTYDPTKFFFSGAVRREPETPHFEYRPRTFADVAVRLSQSHKGVPAVAPRPQADSLCQRCGRQKADHGQKRNPHRVCMRFVSPHARKSPARKEIKQNSEGDHQ
jgi:hypothetical protein